jgi:hypothetical protein
MNPHRYDRLFAAFGVAFVVLELAGLGLGGSIHQLTISSSNGHLAQVLAKPAPTRSWIGAYLELSSFGCFLAFAVWASAKLGGGALGQFARAAGTSYATVSIASLAVVDALSYRAGKGIDLQLGRTLVTVNEALYVSSWFLAAFFLLAAGALALSRSRRLLGWSAIGVALYTLAAAPSFSNLGQFSTLLFFVWTLCASITLARGTRAASTAAVVQHA